MLAAHLRCSSRTHRTSEPSLFKARAHCQHWIHPWLDARNARIGAFTVRSSNAAVGIVRASSQLPMRPERTRSARPGEFRVLRRPVRSRYASHRAGRSPTPSACFVAERILSRRQRRFDSWRQRTPAARPAAVQWVVANPEEPCRHVPTLYVAKYCAAVPQPENGRYAFGPSRGNIRHFSVLTDFLRG